MTTNLKKSAEMERMEKLMAAREILRERGWTKGRLMDEQGHVCAAGALQLAFGIGKEIHYLSPDTHPEFYAALEALRAVLPAREPLTKLQAWTEGGNSIIYNLSIMEPMSVPDYNDALDTTFEDVIALFDRAIQKQCGWVQA